MSSETLLQLVLFPAALVCGAILLILRLIVHFRACHKIRILKILKNDSMNFVELSERIGLPEEQLESILRDLYSKDFIFQHPYRITRKGLQALEIPALNQLAP